MFAPALISTKTLAGRPFGAAASFVVEATGVVSAAARLVRGVGPDEMTPPEPRELRTGTLRDEPVMLVHGLGANKSSFSAMERSLHQAGYTVCSVGYSCVDTDLDACSRHLARAASWVRDQTGAQQAHVVAHSLGGVVLRRAVASTWMREWVGVAVTLGSPHLGAPVARLAPVSLPGYGRIIRQLRPDAGSAIPDSGPGSAAVAGVRWVAVAARHDWLVPAEYARLPEAVNVRNVVLPRGGHMALLTSRPALRLVLQELAAYAGQRTPTAA